MNRTDFVPLNRQTSIRSTVYSDVSDEQEAQLVEQIVILINFLAKNIRQLHSDPKLLEEFESTTLSTLYANHDFELFRILQSCGWTGHSYNNNIVDFDQCLRLLSSYYLRLKSILSVNQYHRSSTEPVKSDSTKNATFSFPAQQDQLLGYILPQCPDILIEILRKNKSIQPPFWESFDGVVLLADISGFTNLAGTLCSKGADGLDELRLITSSFLGKLVKTVYAYNGDVISFAGDALICIFRPSLNSTTDSNDKDNHKEESFTDHSYHSPSKPTPDKRSYIQDAFNCAAEVVTLHEKDLRIHAGLTYGHLMFSILGDDVTKDLVYVLLGSCLKDLALCIKEAQKGELVCTGRYHQLLPVECQECFVKVEGEHAPEIPAYSTLIAGSTSAVNTPNHQTISSSSPDSSPNNEEVVASLAASHYILYRFLPELRTSISNKNIKDETHLTTSQHHQPPRHHSHYHQNITNSIRYKFHEIVNDTELLFAHEEDINEDQTTIEYEEREEKRWEYWQSYYDVLLPYIPAPVKYLLNSQNNTSSMMMNNNYTAHQTTSIASAIHSITPGMHTNKHPATTKNKNMNNSHSDSDGKPSAVTSISISVKNLELPNHQLLPPSLSQKDDIEAAEDAEARQIGAADEGGGELLRSGKQQTPGKPNGNSSLHPTVSHYFPTYEHIGELRQVTTMFVSIDNYQSNAALQHPTKLQSFFLIAQEQLHRTGGYLRQFLVDDKGCVYIAMWGIPFFSYANNGSRAIYCAYMLQQEAKTIGYECSIGIATGSVYCGCVGSNDRQDYVGVGTDVNLAARLMSKAKGGIFIDEKTYWQLNELSKSYLMAIHDVKVKGLDQAITVYQYKSATEVLNVNMMDGADTSMIFSLPPFPATGTALTGNKDISMPVTTTDILAHESRQVLPQHVIRLISNHIDRMVMVLQSCQCHVTWYTQPSSSLTATTATPPFAGAAGAGSMTYHTNSSSMFNFPTITNTSRTPTMMKGMPTNTNTNTTTTSMMTKGIPAIQTPKWAQRVNASLLPSIASVDSSDSGTGGEPRGPSSSSTTTKHVIYNNMNSSQFLPTLSPSLPPSPTSSKAILVLYGLPGTGKTSASDYYRRIAGNNQILCITINAYARHKGVSYSILRKIFIQLLYRQEYAYRYRKDMYKLLYKLVKLVYPTLAQEAEQEIEDRVMMLQSILGIRYETTTTATRNTNSNNVMSTTVMTQGTGTTYYEEFVGDMRVPYAQSQDDHHSLSPSSPRSREWMIQTTRSPSQGMVVRDSVPTSSTPEPLPSMPQDSVERAEGTRKPPIRGERGNSIKHPITSGTTNTTSVAVLGGVEVGEGSGGVAQPKALVVSNLLEHNRLLAHPVDEKVSKEVRGVEKVTVEKEVTAVEEVTEEVTVHTASTATTPVVAGSSSSRGGSRTMSMAGSSSAPVTPRVTVSSSTTTTTTNRNRPRTYTRSSSTFFGAGVMVPTSGAVQQHHHHQQQQQQQQQQHTSSTAHRALGHRHHRNSMNALNMASTIVGEEDQLLVDVLVYLVSNPISSTSATQPTNISIILENAQNCDEMSWKHINQLFTQPEVSLSLVITISVKYTDKSAVWNGDESSQEMAGQLGQLGQLPVTAHKTSSDSDMTITNTDTASASVSGVSGVLRSPTNAYLTRHTTKRMTTALIANQDKLVRKLSMMLDTTPNQPFSPHSQPPPPQQQQPRSQVIEQLLTESTKNTLTSTTTNITTSTTTSSAVSSASHPIPTRQPSMQFASSKPPITLVTEGISNINRTISSFVPPKTPTKAAMMASIGLNNRRSISNFQMLAASRSQYGVNTAMTMIPATNTGTTTTGNSAGVVSSLKKESISDLLTNTQTVSSPPSNHKMNRKVSFHESVGLDTKEQRQIDTAAVSGSLDEETEESSERIITTTNINSMSFSVSRSESQDALRPHSTAVQSLYGFGISMEQSMDEEKEYNSINSTPMHASQDSYTVGIVDENSTPTATATPIPSATPAPSTNTANTPALTIEAEEEVVNPAPVHSSAHPSPLQTQSTSMYFKATDYSHKVMSYDHLLADTTLNTQAPPPPQLPLVQHETTTNNTAVERTGSNIFSSSPLSIGSVSNDSSYYGDDTTTDPSSSSLSQSLYHPTESTQQLDVSSLHSMTVDDTIGDAIVGTYYENNQNTIVLHPAISDASHHTPDNAQTSEEVSSSFSASFSASSFVRPAPINTNTASSYPFSSSSNSLSLFPHLPSSTMTTTTSPTMSSYYSSASSSSSFAASKSIQDIPIAIQSLLPMAALSLLLQEYTEIIELTNLTAKEVKTILISRLGQEVTDELCTVVMSVSNGNPFWCQAIASFIQEQGLTEFEAARKRNMATASSSSVTLSATRSSTNITTTAAASSMNSISNDTPPHPSIQESSNNQIALQSLQNFILYRIDHLSIEYKMLLRDASVINSEFTAELLYHLTTCSNNNNNINSSRSRKSSLAESSPDTTNYHLSVRDERTNTDMNTLPPWWVLQTQLNYLVEKGYLEYTRVFPEHRYIFRNQVIRSAIYRTIPLSDAQDLHHAAGDCIRIQYAHNLRPYYLNLSYHYKKAKHQLPKAFYYKWKSADYAIGHGAYFDALLFLTEALEMTHTISQLDALLHSALFALLDVQEHQHAIVEWTRKLSFIHMQESNHDISLLQIEPSNLQSHYEFLIQEMLLRIATTAKETHTTHQRKMIMSVGITSEEHTLEEEEHKNQNKHNIFPPKITTPRAQSSLDSEEETAVEEEIRRKTSKSSGGGGETEEELQTLLQLYYHPHLVFLSPEEASFPPLTSTIQHQHQQYHNNPDSSSSSSSSSLLSSSSGKFTSSNTNKNAWLLPVIEEDISEKSHQSESSSKVSPQPQQQHQPQHNNSADGLMTASSSSSGGRGSGSEDNLTNNVPTTQANTAVTATGITGGHEKTTTTPTAPTKAAAVPVVGTGCTCIIM